MSEPLIIFETVKAKLNAIAVELEIKLIVLTAEKKYVLLEREKVSSLNPANFPKVFKTFDDSIKAIDQVKLHITNALDFIITCKPLN